jgi:hypothetical protein
MMPPVSRQSRWTISPAALLALGLPLVLLPWIGCAWEYQAATTDGGSTEGGTDTAVADGPITLPDGRVCSGHDEDGDGVPDECDNCPNVVNPGQESVAGRAVGTACAPGASFIPTPTRLLFDPFRSLSSWKSYGAGSGAFAVGPDADSVVAGSATGEELPFLVASSGAGGSAVVATTTLKVTEEATTVPFGSAGLLLRVNGDPGKRFYVCVVGFNVGFGLAWTPGDPCNGGTCDVRTFAATGDAGSVTYQAPIPADIPHKLGDTIGVRGSVATSATDGGSVTDVECRIFDPKRPSTLTSSDPALSLKISLTGTRSFPTGEVGLYARRSRATFGSFDLLRGP